jgi:type III restriction enzyme
MYEKLQKKYDWFYLIRNERFFKLYDFDDGKPFEPDYLLILYQKEKQLYYQVFIEPKGSYLKEKDGESVNVSPSKQIHSEFIFQNV